MASSRREQTLAKLAAIPAAVRARVRETIQAEAANLVATQKRLVAVKSGGLQRSIRYQMGDVAIASSANLSGGGGTRAKGSRSGGSAGGIIQGDPDLTATILAGDAKHFYARFVEFGTKGHTIAPTNTQGSLAINGNWLAPGQAVTHPGSAPQPFFYGPFRAAKNRIKRKVATASGKAVKQAFGK